MAHSPCWSPAELEQLEQLAGDLPLRMLVYKYNRWARSEGLPERTRWAITVKASRLGASLRPIGDWVGIGEVAAILGVSHDTPGNWIDRGLLPCRRADLPLSHRYVRRLDLRRLARCHPHLFGGIARERLASLLEDEALVNTICELFPRRACDPRRTRCLETGRIYESTSAAARAHWLTREGIAHACRTGGTAAGYHWEWIDP